MSEGRESTREVPRRYRFPSRLRLTHDLEFQRVYGARVRRVAGPIMGYAIPNDREVWRLGLSIPRSVGSAVARHALKRQLREAFRLGQHDLPLLEDRGFDLVIAARRHTPLKSAEYQGIVLGLARALQGEWAKRAERSI